MSVIKKLSKKQRKEFAALLREEAKKARKSAIYYQRKTERKNEGKTVVALESIQFMEAAEAYLKLAEKLEGKSQ